MKHAPTSKLAAPFYIRRLLAAGFCVLTCALNVGESRGQESDPAEHETAQSAPPDSRANEADPPMRGFQYFCDIEWPAEHSEGPWLAVSVSPDVFGHAQPDLADLRISDADGKNLPYAIRILEPRAADKVLEAKQFDRVRGEQGSAEISFDLGEQPPEHSELELDLPGIDYRRRVELDAADMPGQWKRLAEGDFIDFRAGDRKVHRTTLSYQPCRFRYLRARLFPDPQVDKRAIEILGSRVHYYFDEPGELIESPAVVESREATRTPDGPGSRWIIELESRNLPVDAILCDVAEEAFARQYALESAQEIEGQTVYSHVESGLWERRAGEPPSILGGSKAAYPLGRLRLVLTDNADPPLTIAAARTRGAVRELVFANTAELRGPLRLYLGDPTAQAPHDDIAHRMPLKLDPPPRRLKLNALQQNPAYTPPPIPLTERWPWAIYLVLGASAISLAAVLVSLGRRTIALHDAEQTATPAPA